MNNNDLKIGDRIVDSDQIYVIFKIEEGKIFYRPTEGKSSCTGSIPIGNLSRACIRPLMSKTEAKFFLENLSDETPLEVVQTSGTRNNNGAFLKDVLYLNNPGKTAKMLIYLSNLGKGLKLSYSDQLVYDQAIKHLSEEVAAVLEIPVEKVEEKILEEIKR